MRKILDTTGGLAANPATNVALLANYMAGSFVTAAHGGGNPLLAEELLHTLPPVTASPHR